MKTKTILLLGLVLAAVFTGIMLKMKYAEPKNRILKISLTGFFKEKVAPENISTIALYHINTNLWDTLITSDRSPAIARLMKISIDQKVYSFEISDFAKFSNSRKITSEDVKFSFERIMAKEENGHANARGIVNHLEVKSPTEVIITLNAPTPSFLFLLSTPEFAIIPKEACDSKTLDIANLNVTSGAYTVKEIDREKKIFRLLKNPFFERHVKESPELVEISFDTANGENLDAMKNGSIQFYEIYNSSADAVIKNLSDHPGKFSYAITKPSLSTFLIRNPKKISTEKAAAFSDLVKDYFLFDTATEKKSVQFLPPRTFGSLSADELPKFNTNTKLEEVIIKVANPKTPLMLALKKIEADAKIKINITTMNDPAEADFIGSSQGMNTDYPEVELFLSLLSPYAFIPAPPEAKNIIEKAFHESDNAKRSQLIKQAGKDLLETGSIIPITVRSYLHVFDSKEIDASGITAYDGDIPFWKIKML